MARRVLGKEGVKLHSYVEVCVLMSEENPNNAFRIDHYKTVTLLCGRRAKSSLIKQNYKLSRYESNPPYTGQQ